MSKSATMKSGASMQRSGKSAAAQSRISRNKKVVVGVAAGILVLGGLIIAARPGPAPRSPTALELVQSNITNPAARLTAEEMSYSFGSISMGRGKVTHRYRITNVGTEPVSIRKLYTSCMCTTAAIEVNGKKSDAFGMPGHTPIPTINVPIRPREEAFVEVIFDPAAHGPAGVGPIDRVVTLENSAGGPLELAFSANVTP